MNQVKTQKFGDKHKNTPDAFHNKVLLNEKFSYE